MLVLTVIPDAYAVLNGAICVELAGRHAYASNSVRSTYLPQLRMLSIEKQMVIYR